MPTEREVSEFRRYRERKRGTEVSELGRQKKKWWIEKEIWPSEREKERYQGQCNATVYAGLKQRFKTKSQKVSVKVKKLGSCIEPCDFVCLVS